MSTSYSSLYQQFCEKAKVVISRKLGRKLTRSEIMDIYRLSNLTFAEMALQDFDLAQSTSELDMAMLNLSQMASQRYEMEIGELDQKLQKHFGVSLPQSTREALARKGTALDIHKFWDKHGETNKLVPGFIRKAQIKDALKDLEKELHA